MRPKARIRAIALVTARSPVAPAGMPARSAIFKRLGHARPSCMNDVMLAATIRTVRSLRSSLSHATGNHAWKSCLSSSIGTSCSRRGIATIGRNRAKQVQFISALDCNRGLSFLRWRSRFTTCPARGQKRPLWRVRVGARPFHHSDSRRARSAGATSLSNRLSSLPIVCADRANLLRVMSHILICCITSS